ncbi:MAG: hypothetical protein KAH57_04405 [Thermoplasmata archaeon]|nr:hypothetical protein [Thermoplasmata archaeon]
MVRVEKGTRGGMVPPLPTVGEETMVEDLMEGLDRAVAVCLVEPSSAAALSMIREARKVTLHTSVTSDEGLLKEATGFHSDCLMLHGSILILESDPEIVKRNVIARAISGIFPVLNTIEEFRSMEDRSHWDLMLDGIGILAELSQATQYLEATRMTANAHSETALVTVEERLVVLARRGAGDIDSKISAIEDFLDDVRRLNLGPGEKPLITFMMWTFISVLSYRRLKDLL